MYDLSFQFNDYLPMTDLQVKISYSELKMSVYH